MRKIDINKKAAIKQAVFELNERVGLSGLSIGKVAKLAAVSPATIYIYYRDKADMLSQILIEVKDLLDDGQEAAIMASEEPIEQLKNFLAYSIRQCELYPREALFMQAALENPTEIAAEGLSYSAKKAEVVEKLYDRLLKSGKIKAYSPDLLLEWTATPIASVLSKHFRAGKKLAQSEIEHMIALSVDAILLH